MKNDGNPISLQERACMDLHILQKRQICEPIVLDKTSKNMNSEEESGTRGGGGGNKAMDCSTHRVLACIACASDRCNTIDTLLRNNVRNKLLEGPDPAHSLDANVAHSTKNRSDLSHNAQYVSRAKGTNFVPDARSRWCLSFLRSAFVVATRSCIGACSTKSRPKCDPPQHPKSQYLHALCAPQEPMKEGSQCAIGVCAGTTHE